MRIAKKIPQNLNGLPLSGYYKSLDSVGRSIVFSTIQAETQKSVSNISRYLSGDLIPDAANQKVISEALGSTPEILFPNEEACES